MQRDGLSVQGLLVAGLAPAGILRTPPALLPDGCRCSSADAQAQNGFRQVSDPVPPPCGTPGRLLRSAAAFPGTGPRCRSRPCDWAVLPAPSDNLPARSRTGRAETPGAPWSRSAPASRRRSSMASRISRKACSVLPSMLSASALTSADDCTGRFSLSASRTSVRARASTSSLSTNHNH